MIAGSLNAARKRAGSNQLIGLGIPKVAGDSTMGTITTQTATPVVVANISRADNPWAQDFYRAFDELVPMLGRAMRGLEVPQMPEDVVINTLFTAIEDGRRVMFLYETPPSHRSDGHIRLRWMKRVSHISRTEAGDVVFQGLDVELRWNPADKVFERVEHEGGSNDPVWRNFRTDRVLAIALAEEAMPYGVAMKGKVWMYPAEWRIRKGIPQPVPEQSVGRYQDQGWSVKPCAYILEPTEAEQAKIAGKRLPVQYSEAGNMIVPGRDMTPREIMDEYHARIAAGDLPQPPAVQMEKRQDKAEMLAKMQAMQRLLDGPAEHFKAGAPCTAVKNDGDLCRLHTIEGSAFCIVHHAEWSGRMVAALRQQIGMIEQSIDGGWGF